jgi:hypothetical protein
MNHTSGGIKRIPRIEFSKETPMPSFEIYYREQDGTLVEKFSVHCATPMHAKVMAHAMKVRPTAEIEVWQGDALVYERPHRVIFGEEPRVPA